MFSDSKRYGIPMITIALSIIIIGVIGSYEMISTKLESMIQTTQSVQDTDLQTNVIMPTALFSQTIKSDHSSFQNLIFQFTIPRQQYVLGEVIEFIVELSNQTDDSILGHSNLRPQYGFLQLRIADKKSTVKDYKASYWDIAESLFVEEILPPGTHISETGTIYFNRSTPVKPDQYLAFSEEGTYYLQAALRNIGTRDLLLSNIVQIEIVQPTGQDAIVWKQLRQYDNANDYQDNYDGGFKFNGLLPLLAQFPDSIYAQNIKQKFAETQPLPSRQESQAQPASVDQPELRSVTVADQHFMVKVLPSVSVENEAALLNELVQLVEQWTSAWNNRDLQAYAESYSYSTYTRQDWEAGPSNRHYNELRDRVEELFVKNGKMAVELFDFTIGANEVTANVSVNFEMGNNKYTFDTMRFVKDDGVWRLASP